MGSSDNAIEVSGLVKRYCDLSAVDDVSFDVPAGEVVALLGHNGAGKTTTVEILEGFRSRDHGRVAVLGQDPATAGRDWRARIGIVPQETGMTAQVTVGEAVTAFADLWRDPWPVDDLLDAVGLADRRQARVRQLSGGQQRRLDLALGLVGRPELLFLDEPTTGFDPAARRDAWQLIRDVCAAGTTILLTTHYLDEADHLADRLVVMSGGRLVARGTAAELIGGLGARSVITFRLPPGATRADLVGVVDGASFSGDRVELQTAEPVEVLHHLTGWARERHHDLASLTVQRPSLEDVYLQLTADGSRTHAHR